MCEIIRTMKILFRYKQLLLLLTAVLVLWLVRVAATGTLRVGYLGWNMFLAGVPIIISELWSKFGARLKDMPRKIVGTMSSLLWVLFLPNAFYILTDFMHLNPDVLVNLRGNVPYRPSFYMRGDGLFVYDTMLIFIATIIGLYLGGLALNNAYNLVKKLYQKSVAMYVVSVLIVLDSVAVYIGRFGRWNSWDAITQPLAVLVDFVQTMSKGEEIQRFVPIFVSITVLQVISFWCIHSKIIRTPEQPK
jgi:uncharacterized membrane protein